MRNITPAASASVLVVSVLCCASGAIAQTPANPVIEGLKVCAAMAIPTDLKKTFNADYSAAFRDALCGDWYNSHKQSIEAGGGIDIPLKVLKIGAHGEYTNEEETVSRTRYCRDTSLVVATSTANTFFLHYMPAENIAGITACIKQVMSSNHMPVEAWATPTPSGVRVNLRNLSPGDGDQFLYSMHPVGLTCSNPGAGKIIAATNEGLALDCRWSGKKTYGEVTLVSGTKPQVKSAVTVSATRSLPAVATVTISHMQDFWVRDGDARKRCESAAPSPNLHEKHCDDRECKQPGLPRDCTNDHQRFCKLVVTTPGIRPAPEYELLRPPYPECRGGGCEWSLNGHPAQVRANADGSSYALASLGSIPNTLSVCVDEQHHHNEPRRIVDQTWSLSDKKAWFIVDYPAGQQLSIKWEPLSSMSGEVGVPRDPPNDALPKDLKVRLVSKQSAGADGSVFVNTYQLAL